MHGSEPISELPANPRTMTAPTAIPATAFTQSRSRLLGRGDFRPQVLLSPLLFADDLDCEPPGYLVGEGTASDAADLGWIQWTLRALDVLAPATFLAAPLTPARLNDLISSGLPEHASDRLLPILEAARTGRRLQELTATRRLAGRAGMRVAITGHRLSSADGFDAAVVERGTAADELKLGTCRLQIVRGVDTPQDLAWAVQRGATLVAGRAVAEPIRVAPIDVSRIREQQSDLVEGPLVPAP